MTILTFIIHFHWSSKMEKALKERNIEIEEKKTIFLVKGETEIFRPQLTNMGGKELSNGDWRFSLKKKQAVLDLLTEEKEEGIEGLSSNPELFTGKEILETCQKENIVSEDGKEITIDTCIKAADESKMKIDPQKTRVVIETELQKLFDLEHADPEEIYAALVGYYGKDIVPLYEDYLPIYHEVLEEVSESFVPFPQDKPPVLSGLSFEEFPTETISTLPITKRKPRKKKQLELDAKTQKLFDDIEESILRDIVSFTPQGVEFIFSETLDEISLSDAKSLLRKQKDEEDKMWLIRKHITSQIIASKTLDLIPNTSILLGYIITNKICCGVKYDIYVEAAVRYVAKRI